MRCKLRQHDAHPLRLRRNLDVADQLLHRQRVDQVVGEVGEIIDAVGQRDHLMPGLDLALFLDAGVQEADVGHRLGDGLAVQFDDHAQHAVRGRVLRTHVEGHAASGRRRCPARVARRARPPSCRYVLSTPPWVSYSFW